MEYKRNGLCVEAMIQHSNSNAILLIKRANDPFKGCWGLPGGFVEFGEHPNNAIAREVKEETGIHLNNYNQVSNYLEEVDGDFRYIILYRRRVELGSFSITIDPNEVLEADWFDLQHLPANVVPGFATRIMRLLNIQIA